MSITAETVSQAAMNVTFNGTRDHEVGGPVTAGWRESTLTRAKEIEALSAWICPNRQPAGSGDCADPEALLQAISVHICAAREAAANHRWFQRRRTAPRMERARSNLDAAEAHLLQVASPTYVLGQMPSLVNHVQRHLAPGDARRKQLEYLAARLGITDPDSPRPGLDLVPVDRRNDEVVREREKIVSAMRAASSSALREQLRLRSFRGVVVASTAVLALLAIGVALIGWLNPTLLPICFQPESGAEILVVCPTNQSVVGPISPDSAPSLVDVDDVVNQTAKPTDLFVIEIVGLTAAAIAAAAAIRGIRGSSERYSLPVALAVLKLPLGAMTAVLGLMLMRGQFIPGLSALDSSAQIVAWALVFGYAQQLFTRMIDQQAHAVLDDVRTPKKVSASS